MGAMHGMHAAGYPPGVPGAGPPLHPHQQQHQHHQQAHHRRVPSDYGAPPPDFGAGVAAAAAAAASARKPPVGGTGGPSQLSAMRGIVVRARKLRKDLNPYLPTVVRLVATFIEDGVRVLFELRHQVEFLRYQYALPAFLARFLLVTSVLVSFVGVALVVGQHKIARGARETMGAYILLGSVLYQQIVYGHDSPITSGNWGFLVRNLCLAGSLILIVCQSRLAAGQSALPLGLLDGRAPDKKDVVAYLQLASRILLVLLGLEFILTLGIVGTILTVPVTLAVLMGFYTEISGAILLMLYFLHNVLNSAFWFEAASHMREIRRYEFVQTLSIMGGLILLISVGPGSLSIDELRGRKAF
jgi:ER-derived vesicles protein